MALGLMIIDQQKGIDEPRLGLRNNPDAEKEMLNILTLWRRLQWPVIHVKHCSIEPDSVFWPEQSGFDFKPEFEPLCTEHVIEKSVPCAFTQSKLSDLLQVLGINEMAMMGVATNNSIEATARTGGNLGYKLHVIENACFCFAKTDYFGRERSAHDVHAMSLANINGEYATVINRRQLFQMLNAAG